MTGSDIVDIAGVALLIACWLVGYLNYRGRHPALVSRLFFLFATGALLLAFLGIVVSKILSTSGQDGGVIFVDIATGVAGVVVFIWFVAYGFRQVRRPRGSL